MDQDEFRRTYQDVNENFCAFEKGVLTNQCDCRHAERFCIAEREGVRCQSEANQKRCLAWLELLREQARFALRTRPDDGTLPHGKAIRVQIGGLRGLAEVLTVEDGTSDVAALLERAEQTHGELTALPFHQIMPAIANYQGRVRSRRRERRKRD